MVDSSALTEVSKAGFDRTLAAGAEMCVIGFEQSHIYTDGLTKEFENPGRFLVYYMPDTSSIS